MLAKLCMLLVQMWIFDLVLMFETGGKTRGGNFCEFHTFNASCQEDEVIVMKSAKYGRMQIGECVVSDLGFVGCHSNVLDLADRRCSGRRTCEIRLPDQMFANTNPCLSELKLYLEARYSCLKVVKPRETQCNRCSHVKVAQPSGYISSSQTYTTGCGSPDCPWLLEGRPGQRLNISLVNFAWTSKERSNGHQTPCKVYATLKELTGSRGETICAENLRQSPVYTSISNSVELRIVGKGDEQFLFRYEAIGCGEPDRPLGGWVKQESDVVHVGCPGSDRQWTMRCLDGRSWHSDEAVPTSCGDRPSDIGASSSLSEATFPYGTSIAVVVLVAVVVGAVILVIGLYLVRRRYMGQRPPQVLHPCSPSTAEHNKDKIYQPSAFDSKSLDFYHDYERQPPSITSSGYAHIWDRPLPMHPQTLQDCSCSAQQYNLVGSTPVEIYKARTPGEVYGNHTMARKEVEGSPMSTDAAEISTR